MKSKVAFHTLGCKLNFAETSTIGEQFLKHDFDIVNYEQSADVYVINTCTVTESADKECRQIVRRALQNNLMLAEAILRGGGAGDALQLVNDVRASYLYNGLPIAPLASVDLDVIYVERDKELFVRGSRMLDQHRFDKWDHLPAGRAKFLPLPRREIDGNPNY